MARTWKWPSKVLGHVRPVLTWLWTTLSWVEVALWEQVALNIMENMVINKLRRFSFKSCNALLRVLLRYKMRKLVIFVLHGVLSESSRQGSWVRSQDIKVTEDFPSTCWSPAGLWRPVDTCFKASIHLYRWIDRHWRENLLCWNSRFTLW